MKGLLIAVTLGLALVAAVGQAGDRSLLIDNFEHGLSPKWQTKSFKGQTLYRVVPDGGGHVLEAVSHDAASGLIYPIKFSLRDYPILSWRWKVSNILPKGDARIKAGDDYAARVYVVFPSWFPPATRSINYIWANRLPRGTHVPNPFFSRAVMVAVESGPSKTGRWVSERRNVYEDYRKIFGGEPPEAGAIAIMTDTDNTGGSATAWYDDITLERGKGRQEFER
ncbi:MAG TPA: DUF3047 domain-containing protein [Desulfuromonadales bacterium]|nr:DUF3047 domain-containing protein [Desulfuromonadales bacterium]